MKNISKKIIILLLIIFLIIILVQSFLLRKIDSNIDSKDASSEILEKMKNKDSFLVYIYGNEQDKIAFIEFSR